MQPRRTFLTALSASILALAGTGVAQAEDIKLRIASGHPAVNTYVNLMQTFFVPEVTKRVKEKTQHTVEFVEGYGGSMVKVADTLEGVQTGIIDIGGYCFCFEPSNLPLHAFQVMLPFGTMRPGDEREAWRAPCTTRCRTCPRSSRTSSTRSCIALIADNGYNLGTNFEWKTVADLKGQKLAGAGLNLKWLEFAGAIPVQSSLPEAYTGMQTGVYNGWIMFPSGVGELQALRGRQVLHRGRLRRDHLARAHGQQGALGEAAEGRAGHHAPRSRASTRRAPAR